MAKVLLSCNARSTVGKKQVTCAIRRTINKRCCSSKCHELSQREIEEHVTAATKDGFTVLRNFIPVSKIDAMSRAILPLLHKRIELGEAERGANRWYVTPPFRAPFADETIFSDPGLLSIVEGLVGKDPVLCQWASDTPMNGSEYQEIHRDTAPLFEGDLDWNAEPPMYQLGVNFPLCDVLSMEKGPLEVIRGTHRMTLEDSERMKADGSALKALEPVFMRKGDLMVRDVRGLHRGTPNNTDEPRVMIVIGYSRKWLRRPEVCVRIPESVWNRLSTRSQHLLRFEPVCPDAEIGEYSGKEGYDAKSLTQASGKSFKGKI
ncbi:uncharacterized protein LOC135824429 [Sycon ciliatum]|uniref:uncharacterized protein LOC135824429 n=1 Tax=Sycon ciliatum TaxID=27933 RepID=UPI0031F6F04C